MTAPQISKNQLMDIETFADAIDVLTEIKAFEPDEANPFPLMPAEYKERLVGIPFIIVEATLQPGLDGSEFYEIALVTYDNVCVTIRDSSRGIFNQLKRMIAARTEKGRPHPQCGFYVRKGLRYTSTPFTDPATMVTTESRTYHLTL